MAMLGIATVTLPRPSQTSDKLQNPNTKPLVKAQLDIMDIIGGCVDLALRSKTAGLEHLSSQAGGFDRAMCSSG